MDPEHEPDPRRQRRRLRPARLHPRRAARDTDLRIHPAELRRAERAARARPAERRASTIKLTCRTKQGTFLPTEISLHALEIDGTAPHPRPRPGPQRAPPPPLRPLSRHTGRRTAAAGTLCRATHLSRAEGATREHHNRNANADCADACASSTARSGSAPTSAASSSPTRPARCSSGRSRTTRPTTSRSPTSAPSCCRADGGVAHSPSRGDGQHLHRPRRRQGGRRRRAPLRAVAVRGAARRDPARLARDGRVVRGGRAGVHAPARPVHPRRHPPQLAPRPGRGRRRHDRRDDEADARLRDRPPGALLPAEDARAHGSADADRHRSATARTRARPSTGRCASDDASCRRGVVVPDAAPREPEDRRPDQLLPGARSTSTSTGSNKLDVRPRPRGRARSRLRARPGRRSVRRGERGRMRDARLQPSGAARDPGLAHPSRRAAAAPGLRRARLARRPRLDDHPHLPNALRRLPPDRDGSADV